jgi:anti-sigma28 factor (negative regulator of flagellin synthesis)
MTPSTLRRTAAAGLLAIATVGATLGVASAQQATAPTSAATERIAQEQQPNQPGRPGRGGPGQDGAQRPHPTDAQRQEMEQRRAQAEQQYIDLLAKNLNMDSSTIRTALEQTRQDLRTARIAEIKQAVTDGKLTQEQADQMIQRLQQAPFPLMGPMGGPGFGRGMGGPGGMRNGPDGGRNAPGR